MRRPSLTAAHIVRKFSHSRIPVSRTLLCLVLLLIAFALVLGSKHSGPVFVAHANVAELSGDADDHGDGFSPKEWALIHTLSPLPGLPVDTTNRYRDSDAAA